MTFGAMAAWQAWLLIGGAAVLAIWLFLRKLRPPRIPVASLLLWRRVLDEARQLTIWERVRRAVSLILTLAIALALTLAVTRPARRTGGPSLPRGPMFVIIDSSWSMLARTANGESRWDRARAEARRLATAAAGDEVALATTADGLVAGPTTDVSLIVNALDHLTAGGGDAASWPQLAGTDSVHFITDGAVARPAAPDVIVHSVFERAENVAITALDVRPSLAAGHADDAYLEVANFASSAQVVHLTLTRGTAAVLERQLNLGAGETLRQVIPLSRGTDAALHAHVEAPHDALRIDDEAYAWIEHATPLAVTVVGESTSWLHPLLDTDQDASVRFIDGAAYEAARQAPGAAKPGEGSDLFIFDRWAPGAAPAAPAILIAPPVDTPWLVRQRNAAPPVVEKKPRWESVGPHPVVRGVDPLTLIINSARSYGVPGMAAVAESSQGTPLIYAGEAPGQRLVLLTFGPGDSNLASAPAFPVLIGNALDWLVRRDTRRTRPPGLATFADGAGRLIGPDGAAVPLAKLGGATLGLLRAPGFYVVEDGASRSTFAVNVGDPEISNAGRTTLTPSELARPVRAGIVGGSWWIYCAALAFVLAMGEWWTWQRRITV